MSVLKRKIASLLDIGGRVKERAGAFGGGRLLVARFQAKAHVRIREERLEISVVRFWEGAYVT